MTARAPAEQLNDDTLWDVKDVARYLKVSASWIYKLAEIDDLPHFRVGTLLRFNPPAIRGWLAAKKSGMTSLTASAIESVDVTSTRKG